MMTRPQVLRAPQELYNIAENIPDGDPVRDKIAGHLSAAFVSGLGSIGLATEAAYMNESHPVWTGIFGAATALVAGCAAIRYVFALESAQQVVKSHTNNNW